MGLTLTEKILKAHLVEGEMVKGSEIGIRIDQTLTQDATGTMAYLEFEAMGVPRVRTERSVAYIDHNTLQNGFENADDHRFIGSVAKKHGIYGTRPLAYYQGSNALYDLSVSTDETDREFFHEFCSFVVNNPVRTQHSGKGNK